MSATGEIIIKKEHLPNWETITAGNIMKSDYKPLNGVVSRVYDMSDSIVILYESLDLLLVSNRT
jgi:hypothetical protein